MAAARMCRRRGSKPSPRPEHSEPELATVRAFLLSALGQESQNVFHLCPKPGDAGACQEAEMTSRRWDDANSAENFLKPGQQPAGRAILAASVCMDVSQ